MSVTASRLDPNDVIAHLRNRGVHLTHPRVQELTGGVSSAVFRIDSDTESLVVKRPLSKLRVSTDWRAPLSRAQSEAAAMSLLHRHHPGRAPSLIDFDPDTSTIIMTAAPARWTTWKSQLMSGVVDPRIAYEVGRTAAFLHALPYNPVSDEDRELFFALRIEPYYLHTARAHPTYAHALRQLAHSLEEQPDGFTHGDFSPKNILNGAGAGNPWILDFEVARPGRRVFDIAFLTAHLTLKSIHLPALAGLLQDAMSACFAGYAEVSKVHPQEMPDLDQQVGALLLARVSGRSPVEYLDASQAHTAVVWGGQLLTQQVTLADVGNRWREEVGR